MNIPEIEILIADDHPIVRQGLRQTLENVSGFRIVAEVSDGARALAKLRELKPTVALLDIDMPLLDGMRVAALAREEGLPVKLIFLTVHKDQSFLDKALKLGVEGYILKDAPPMEIIMGVKAVAAGQPFVSPTLTASLLQRRAAVDQTGALPNLTPTERAVIKLIAEFLTTKQIAERLFISHRTVETHRANICQKLGLRGNHALTRYALAHQAEL